ncbi:hypothetical protein OUZ56_031841 [Daphnia magna]|uniref:Uncharacterized protein n=1 Tax=Daphnia magna TaxID=35525 RepID=A0ABQ9ZVC6_9CRUS|nr:hypothetical protein OUZ56_031841 [Daphnia magna]
MKKKTWRVFSKKALEDLEKKRCYDYSFEMKIKRGSHHIHNAIGEQQQQQQQQHMWSEYFPTA